MINFAYGDNNKKFPENLGGYVLVLYEVESTINIGRSKIQIHKEWILLEI